MVHVVSGITLISASGSSDKPIFAFNAIKSTCFL